jgi:hypothetical protein
MPTMNMTTACAALVQRRLLRLPRESAAKRRKQRQPATLTMPYTPVARSETREPLRPRAMKIWGA